MSEDIEIPETPEEEYTKEVTMVSYAPQEVNDWRDWLQNLVDVDLKEKSTHESEEWSIELDPVGEGDDFDKFTRSLSTVGIREEVVEEICNDVSKVDNVEMEFSKENKSGYSVSKIMATSKVLRHILEDVPDTISGSLDNYDNPLSWNEPSEHEFSVRITGRNISEMRVLSKEEKREDDDMYETLGERVCFKFMVKMTAPSREFIDTWTEELIPEIHKALARQQEFEKVRYMSCTTQVSREGECYNI